MQAALCDKTDIIHELEEQCQYVDGDNVYEVYDEAMERLMELHVIEEYENVPTAYDIAWTMYDDNDDWAGPSEY